MASDTAPDTARDTARRSAPERVNPIPNSVRCHEDADGIVVWLPVDDTDDDTDDDADDSVDVPDGAQVDQG